MNTESLRGRVRFPIGGIVRERANAGFGKKSFGKNVYFPGRFKSGFGEIPKPTV